MDEHTHSTADGDRTDDETTPGADGWGVRPDFWSDARAASETVGTVLLIGMVATGIVVVSVAGVSALNSLQTDIDQEENEVQVREVDSRLSSLSQSGATATELSFSQDSVESIDVRNGSAGGTVRVSVSGGACSVTLPMSSIRYDERGQTTVYEGGGVFRVSDGGLGVAVVSPPDITVEDGTVDISLVNLTSGVGGDRATVLKRGEFSATQSAAFEDRLFTGAEECRRPDNVTIAVTSEYHRGWAAYLEGETGNPVQSTGPDTVAVELTSADLPASTDDSRNAVVNLSDPNPNTTVTVTENTIMVNKNASNRYTATARPLAEGVQVSSVKKFETNVAYRRPIDVVFVFDESGSMNYDDDANTYCTDSSLNPINGPGNRWGQSNDPGCETRMDRAKAAAKTFVGLLNESRDRGGVVGFSSSEYTRYVTTPNGRYMTDDFGSSGLNGSIDRLVTGGSTESATGIHRANVVHDLKGESAGEPIVVLLSDGQDDGDAPDPIDEAAIASENNVTIHTVGFGDGADNATLQAIADETGGTYHYAAEDDDLSDVFTDVFETIAETDVIVNEPVTLSTGVGGQVYQPSLGGNADYVATVTEDGASNVNVNDPTAPAFRFSMTTADGDLTAVNATSYDCEEYSVTDIVKQNATSSDLVELRCTDIDESSGTEVPPSNVTVYLDGDDAGPLINESSAWWDGDIRNDTLKQGASDALVDANDTFTLASNQAIVVFEFGANDEASKRLVMLYEIGLPEDTTARDVVDIDVTTADVED
jgi:Mg-chelatase subunit ChlD